MKKSKGFWQNFKKPICALAPMAGYTDSAFRRICRENGADVVYSEMASSAALVYSPKKTLELLEFFVIERPYIVQLFGSDPKHFVYAAKFVENKLKPDGIDINFGCPVKKVQKQGAGAVLMDDLKLSRKIIKSVIDNTKLPVSVKTRSKAKKVDVLEFLDYMKGLDIKAAMIHGRTLAQGFSGEINCKIIKKARNYFGGVILANGGIDTAEDALKLLEKTGADGVGIARGALGKPWIFENIKCQNSNIKTNKDIFKIALRHAKLAYKLKGKQGIMDMRKHLCWYVAGLPNAKELRQKLVRVESSGEIEKILKL